jgi:transcriptional regulator with XRE-family HTH domain
MDHSPTVHGRRLTRELIRLRQASGLSLDVAAERLGFSNSKLYRLEAGRTRITTDDLEDMLDLYGVRSPRRDALIQLGRDARKRGWWTAYSDAFTGSYVGLEADASAIRVNAHVIPGLFQTPHYAREVITRTGLTLTPEEAERKVEARAARQHNLLDHDLPPQIHMVLDETALPRRVGGPHVLAHQLTALADATTRRTVTLQVLPFDAGAYVGMDGEFTILAFPDPQDPPIAYVEGLMGDVYLESEDELDLYNLAWTHLISHARDPAESIDLITQLAKEHL